MAYVSYPVDVDAGSIAQRIVAALRDLEPEWEPQPGNLDWLLIESIAGMHASLLATVSDVRDAIFRHAGLALFVVAPIDAAPAAAMTTWTMVDSAGYTVPQGTQVAYQSGGDTRVFETTQAFTVPAGQSVQTGVLVSAIEAGAAGNGLTGPVVSDSTVPWVASVTQAAATSGGEDGETDAEYLARLPREIAVQRTPVRVEDFQAVALRVPGVGRAVAIDGWDTTTDTMGNERTVGIVVTDPAGVACTPAVKAAVVAAVEKVREVNFIVGVTDPTMTPVTVTYTATCYPGFTADEVRGRVDDAITAWLSPAWWGVPPLGDEITNEQWINEPTVRVNDLIALIDGVDGVRTVTSVQVDGGGDLMLPGRVGLPSPQPPVGTVTAT